ncbi:Uncharacterised protein [Vibrio cholerae]|nr:Uncharacterised protein [Vibrio cholerae]
MICCFTKRSRLAKRCKSDSRFASLCISSVEASVNACGVGFGRTLIKGCPCSTCCPSRT